jgi:hypothetical protein
MAKVIGLRMVGSFIPGSNRCHGRIMLDTGETIYVSNGDDYPDKMLEIAAQSGHDIADMKQDLDHWVKTGQFRDGSIAQCRIV